jgi:hypothetical protein
MANNDDGRDNSGNIKCDGQVVTVRRKEGREEGRTHRKKEGRQAGEER